MKLTKFPSHRTHRAAKFLKTTAPPRRGCGTSGLVML